MVSIRMDPSRIDKLRERGFLETGPDGQECVRLSLQQPARAEGLSRGALKDRLEQWVERLRDRVAEHGGAIVPGSLSTVGQTVEALVPVDLVGPASADLKRLGVRIDLVETRQIV